MPSRTRRSSRRFRRGKREVIWTSVVFEGVTPDVAPGTNSSLVLPADWVRNTGSSSFQKGCVLERIRGYVTVHRDQGFATETTGIAGVTVYGVIWKSEEEEDFAANDWSQSSPYNDEDILWTDGWTLQGASNVPSGTPVQQLVPAEPHQFYVDVKTRRKLTSDDQIVFTMQAGNAAPGAEYSGVLRCLLTLP